ncbi:MAG: tetratricopeptide repeat protein [Treponema sp.]|nr:tetratricopeptide repeat protein [Treponema sp.]
MMVRSIPVVLILLTFASCATAVTFIAEHPPLVDLRNVTSITVIPFEWSSSREDERLAALVTNSLMNGLRMGIVNTVDPSVLDNVSTLNYWRFVDVYISGRITDVRLSGNTSISDEQHGAIIRRRTTYSGFVSIEIEYRYIRTADNRVLGTFRKREEHSDYFYRIENIHQDIHWNQPPGPPGRGNNPHRNQNRSTERRPGLGRLPWQTTLQRIPWLLPIAETAISKFTHTMTNELGPWTTEEKRTIRKSKGRNSQADNARQLVRQGRYHEALDIYKTIYEQDGSIFAGYNVSMLLAADNRFADALALLENLHNRSREMDRRIPSFLAKEIRKMVEIVNGLMILGEYRENRANVISQTPASAGSNVPQNIPQTTMGAAVREISGTATIFPALVYALSSSISSLDDDSIFTKMIATTSTEGERWSMMIANTSPASLWFIVTDGYNDYYITGTAVNTLGVIVLDTAAMIRLE